MAEQAQSPQTTAADPHSGEGATETYVVPSTPNYVLSLVGVVGTLLLFALIVGITYVYNQPPEPDQAIIDNRLQSLAELEAQMEDTASGYAWVDQEAGTVRIPIGEAVAITTERLRRGEPVFPHLQEAGEGTQN